MHSKHAWQLSAAAAALLALSACGGGSANGKTEGPDGELQYNTDLALLPSPNDLAFAGSTDGTLNGTGNAALDATDGFSTTATATATASVPIEPGSVEGGSSVRVFEVTTVDGTGTPAQPNDAANPGPKGVGAVNRELTAGTEYTASLSAADRNNRTVAATPLAPLAPDTTYMVVLTNGLQDTDGDPLEPSDAYAEAKTSDPLVQSHLAAAGGEGVNTDDVIASWTFTTQTIGRSLDMVRDSVQGNPVGFADTQGDANQLTPIPGSALPVEIPAGDIYAGVIAGLPYYLEPGSSDPQNVLTGSWKTAGGDNLNPTDRMPQANTTIKAPVLVALPANDDGTARDVVIFQHGITSNRTAMLGIANALTKAGLAVVAIDLPLHGITDKSSGLYAGDAERTFNVDLIDNDTGASGADGEIDPSGEHFINLASLLTSRDNLRQASVDLFSVTRAVLVAAGGGVDFDDSDGDTAVDFSTNVRFLGHSLGGIVGGPFVATEPNVGASVFGMSGGHIAKVLDGSPEIGPEIAAGLEAQGLSKGSPRYEQFLGAAQTAIDKGDPVNYTTRTNAGGSTPATGTTIPDRNVLAIEVVGGNSSEPDQVVPNVVSPDYPGAPANTVPSPTAGSTPLYGDGAMGLTPIDEDSSLTTPRDYLIQYVAGGHASLLLQDSSPAATKEMQTNVASFLRSGGTVVQTVGTGTIAQQ